MQISLLARITRIKLNQRRHHWFTSLRSCVLLAKCSDLDDDVAGRPIPNLSCIRLLKLHEALVLVHLRSGLKVDFALGP